MEEALQQILDALLNGLVVVIVITIGAFVTGFRTWIIAKAEQLTVDKSAKEVTIIREVTDSVVKYFDQVQLNLDNTEKAQQAKQKAADILAQRHVKASDAEIEANLEASVNDARTSSADTQAELMPVIGFAMDSVEDEYWDEDLTDIDESDYTIEETGTAQREKTPAQ